MFQKVDVHRLIALILFSIVASFALIYFWTSIKETSVLSISLWTSRKQASVPPPPPLPSIDQMKGLVQNDSQVLSYIRKHHLTTPPLDTQPYNLTVAEPHINEIWTDSVSPYVHKLLKFKYGGFFIECGANDGEFLSNTLTLELKYGWTGLLVEADPEPFKVLRKRNRRAWLANVCLATLPYPHKAEMLRHNSWNGVSYIPKHSAEIIRFDQSTFNTTFSVDCFPIFSLLSAIDVKVVDYLSLDIEGAELAVLKTFPFDGPILIKVISAEVSDRKSENLSNFLISKGYRNVQYFQGPYVHDLVFAHSSVKDI